MIQTPDGVPINFYQHFAEETEKLGMKGRSSWLVGADSAEPIEHKQQYGYDLFQELWNQDAHHRDCLFSRMKWQLG